MFLRFCFSSLILVLLVSACGSNATPAPTATATLAPTAVPSATAVPPTPTLLPTNTLIPPTATSTLTLVPPTATTDFAAVTKTAIAQLPTKTPMPTNTTGPTTVVLEDDFSGTCALNVVDDDTRKMGCGNGVYTIFKKKANSTQWVYYSKRENTNAIYEVDGQFTKDTGPMLWALIFRVSKDGNRFYELILDNGGQVGLNEYVRGQKSRALLPFAAAPAYKPGVMNRLKAIAQGTSIAVYLNDVWINTVTDAALTSGSTGVLVSNQAPDAQVTFDNFKVTRLNSNIALPKGVPPPAAAAPPTNPPASSADSNPCQLQAGESGLLLVNNYDVEVLMTLGGGEWGTHDYRTGAKTTLPMHFPPGKYTTTLTVPGVGKFRFAQDRFDFQAGKCYTFRVP